MARQISVSEEVYTLLKKAKGKRSFSEAIKERFGRKGKKQNLMKFFGVIGDKEAEELLNASKTFRKNFRPRKFAGL